MSTIDILVISLKTAVSRRDHQIRQASALGLTIEFVDAIQAGLLSAVECQRAVNRWTRPLQAKDIACYHSHRTAWAVVVQRQRPCVILEDDVLLHRDIQGVLQTIQHKGMAQDEAYDLEFVPRPHTLSRSASWTSENFCARRIYENRNGLGAYVIGPNVAKRMLNESTDFALIDAFFWNRRWLQAYQVEPAVAVQMVYHPSSEAYGTVDQLPAQAVVYAPESFWRSRYVSVRNELRKVPSILRGALRGVPRRIQFDATAFTLRSQDDCS